MRKCSSLLATNIVIMVPRVVFRLLAILMPLSAVQALSSSPQATTRSSASNIQERAGEIALSFKSDQFNPLIKEGHSQTILGHFFRSTVARHLPSDNPWPRVFQGLSTLLFDDEVKAKPFWDKRETVRTPDGDFFHADYKFGPDKNAPVVVLCHGLASSSEANLSKDLAQAFVQKGLNCICLNFRGCSGVPNDKLGAYHLGFTDDLKHFLGEMSERSQSRVYLCGFSLGANVVLKCLGELEEDALYEYNVHGAVALCAPLDQTKNAYILMKEGINRRIYTGNLLKALKGMAQEQFERFCNGDPNTTRINYEEAMNAKFISEFDNGFIAPIYGFRDCWDYYEKTSSIYFLDRIAVPTLVLNAKDDPFFDPMVWPLEKSIEFGGRSPLKMIRMDCGGHLGFCFNLVEPGDPRLNEDSPTWVAVEAARFLNHVEEHPRTKSLR